MGSLGSIFKELVGLFVDDGYLALAVVIWVGLTWLFAGLALGLGSVAAYRGVAPA